jgi:hypothetical protein
MNPSELIFRIAKLYRRGVINCGSAWHDISNACAGEDVVKLVNSLSAEQQQFVRETFLAEDLGSEFTLPELQDVVAGLDHDPAYQAFLAWCQERLL